MLKDTHFQLLQFYNWKTMYRLLTKCTSLDASLVLLIHFSLDQKRRQVLPAVPYLLDSVQVEGTFPDGTKLITIHDPVSCENGNLELALHGSFLPVPSLDKFPSVENCKIPGELILQPGLITINPGRKGVVLKVTDTGDRPIQMYMVENIRQNYV